MEKRKNQKYDVFVSHASEDKLSYVDMLVEEFKKQKLKVFYDSDSIKWGDSLKGKIDEGLKNCAVAVIVISKKFFDKDWTEYELYQLWERQLEEDRKIILPILYRVNKSELVEHYPMLGDVKFKYSTNCSRQKMALEVKEIIAEIKGK